MTGKRYIAEIRKTGFPRLYKIRIAHQARVGKIHGRNAQGDYYQYQGQNNRVHWSGTVPQERVPMWIRKALATW